MGLPGSSAATTLIDRPSRTSLSRLLAKFVLAPDARCKYSNRVFRVSDQTKDAERDLAVQGPPMISFLLRYFVTASAIELQEPAGRTVCSVNGAGQLDHNGLL